MPGITFILHPFPDKTWETHYFAVSSGRLYFIFMHFWLLSTFLSVPTKTEEDRGAVYSGVSTWRQTEKIPDCKSDSITFLLPQNFVPSGRKTAELKGTFIGNQYKGIILQPIHCVINTNFIMTQESKKSLL